MFLGFDSFQLPDGKGISVVDVPGHRDFIENMLSGIGSIDACLLVIAADEGVMPQTREHLDILDLLEVDKGVVALTKTDLVDDPDWLDLVEVEIRDLIFRHSLEGCPHRAGFCKNQVWHRGPAHNTKFSPGRLSQNGRIWADPVYR